ncbi:hypothetical protein SARC_14696, partial [Sphaeroforma arctica JP610]
TYREDNGTPPGEWTFYMKTWVVVSIVQTIYALTYDFKMDWGLFKANDRSNLLLRDTIFYNKSLASPIHVWTVAPLSACPLPLTCGPLHPFPRVQVYYVAVVFDVIGRCFWTLKILPVATTTVLHTSSVWFTFGVATVEILRYCALIRN